MDSEKGVDKKKMIKKHCTNICEANMEEVVT